MPEKYLVVVNPTGLQAFNLSEVIPQVELVLKKKLKWYLLSFGGNFEEEFLNIDLSNYLGLSKQELTPEIISKFDFGPHCEFHEGSIVGIEEKIKLPMFNVDKFLIDESIICLSYDHLNTASIFSKSAYLIDELAKVLTRLDRYAYLRDSSGQKIELPVLMAEGVIRAD